MNLTAQGHLKSDKSSAFEIPLSVGNLSPAALRETGEPPAVIGKVDSLRDNRLGVKQLVSNEVSKEQVLRFLEGKIFKGQLSQVPTFELDRPIQINDFKAPALKVMEGGEFLQISLLLNLVHKSPSDHKPPQKYIWTLSVTQIRKEISFWESRKGAMNREPRFEEIDLPYLDTLKFLLEGRGLFIYPERGTLPFYQYNLCTTDDLVLK